jgi:protein-tyrosine phosphatase
MTASSLSRDGMISILFVCMGNICRSPAAEGYMRHLVKQRGLEDRIRIDSAGTLGYHAGSPPDARMLRETAERGYVLDHRARQVRPSDLQTFDYVVAMDEDNLDYLKQMARGVESRARIGLLLDAWPDAPTREVPDPYYGRTQESFRRSVELIERGCEALLDQIVREHVIG